MSQIDQGKSNALTAPSLIHRWVMSVLGLVFLACGLYAAWLPMTWGVALVAIILLLVSADLLMSAIHKKFPLLSKLGPLP